MEPIFILTNDANHIRELVAQGFCPIECSIGGESITDNLKMDHHGKLSRLEAVSIRAYRDHYGARKDDPRFVTTGNADADCCFTAAALAALIPHPDRQTNPALPPHVKDMLTKDLGELATTVARTDINPIGLDITSIPGGPVLLTWNTLMAAATDSLSFQTGVGLWRSLTEGNPASLSPILESAKALEENRRSESLSDMSERGIKIGAVLVIKGSRCFGFPEWYGRIEQKPFDAISGWHNPIVMSWEEQTQSVTIGCPNNNVAEAIFGKGGLCNIFPSLLPKGWGGRESVGGSPRGLSLTWQQVKKAAVATQPELKPRNRRSQLPGLHTGHRRKPTGKD